MDFTKYSTTELENSLELFKALHSHTGDLFHLNMVMNLTEELNKRKQSK